MRNNTVFPRSFQFWAKSMIERKWQCAMMMDEKSSMETCRKNTASWQGNGERVWLERRLNQGTQDDRATALVSLPVGHDDTTLQLIFANQATFSQGSDPASHPFTSGWGARAGPFLYKSNKPGEEKNSVKCPHVTRQNNWQILALGFNLI